MGHATTYRQREHSFGMEADDDMVVVDRHGAKMLTLNAAGGVLWQRAAQPASFDDFVAALATHWPDVGDEQLRIDVEVFVANAIKADIIVPADD